jgi:hypothetical protein
MQNANGIQYRHQRVIIESGREAIDVLVCEPRDQLDTEWRVDACSNPVLATGRLDDRRGVNATEGESRE